MSKPRDTWASCNRGKGRFRSHAGSSQGTKASRNCPDLKLNFTNFFQNYLVTNFIMYLRLRLGYYGPLAELVIRLSPAGFWLGMINWLGKIICKKVYLGCKKQVLIFSHGTLKFSYANYSMIPSFSTFYNSQNLCDLW